MQGRIPTAVLTIALMTALGRPAIAQKEILDNIILLGPSETLNLPGVDRVEERPEEKAPPEPYGRMLGGGSSHRPLSTRFGPHESYVLEEGPALRNPSQDMQLPGRMEARRGTSAPDATGPVPLPRSAPGRAGTEGGSFGSPLRTVDFDDPGPPGGMTVERSSPDSSSPI